MTFLPHALRRALAAASVLALTATAVAATTATASAQQSSPQFSDMDQTVHADAIRLVAEDGITRGYPDGTFRPREDVRRDQMGSFLAAALRLQDRPSSFPDVPSSSVHAPRIGAIAHAGITKGYPDGTYRPLEYVTRGQMATFLAAGFDLPPSDRTFDDVPPGYVHARAIAALAGSGITEGFPDGTFRPNALIKRDQMAAFLARAIPLPRTAQNPCPGSATAASTSTTSSSSTASGSDDGATATTTAGTTAATERGSEDLLELREGVAVERSTTTTGSDRNLASTDLGPAVPGTAFPLTSVLRTSSSTLEVHTQDLPSSRGARVDTAGDVTATTTIPAGRRTWATAQIGQQVYVGQWGAGSGTNLYRYATDTRGPGDRRATAVATVPTGNEFWTLAADPQGRLWAGTRAHADGTFRASIGLGNGRDDGRHVVHRIAPGSGQDGVAAVTFCAPSLPTTSAGLRPDVKQLAWAGSTLYVGTGQQTGGARLYAFEPGNRTDVPRADVRDLTPNQVRSATGIFALTADDRYVAFGTQVPSGQTARLVVIDRATEQVRVNVALSGETRVDAVTISGDQVAATGFSGRVWTADVPRTGVRTSATALEAPVTGQFHRFVEFTGDGGLQGVTQQGVVWTRTPRGEVDRVNLVDTGAPVAPGLPHSLHVGSADVAVGASSAITLRTASPAGEPRTVNISGEAKAITSAADGTTFAASYPNAGLWRIAAGGDDAQQVRRWSGTFLRPASADHDDRTGRVNVVARDDNAPMSEPRDAPQANFQFRPSRLFSLDPTPSTVIEPGHPLGRSGSSTSTVTAEVASRVPVEASRVLAGTSEGGREVFVGDTRGGVQRVDSATGARDWYRPPADTEQDRPIVGLDLVGDRLVVVHSGYLRPRSGGDVYGHRTVIRELDPVTGRVLASTVATNSEGQHFSVPDAFTTGSLTVMPSVSVVRYFDRATGTYDQTSHSPNASFGGPYASFDRANCRMYSFERRPSHLVRTPLTSGECAPVDPPLDPGDPIIGLPPLPRP